MCSRAGRRQVCLSTGNLDRTRMLMDAPFIPGIVGFDYETHARQPLPMDAKPVCLSIYTAEPLPPGIPFREYTKPGAARRAVVYRARHAKAVLDWFMAMPHTIMCGTNAPFDIMISVLCSGVSMRAWADLLDAGRVADSLLREQILCIAHGYTESGSLDPRTNQPAKKFGLDRQVLAHFGVDLSDEKVDPNAWRMNYHLLDGIPLDMWPDDAISYSAMDPLWSVRVVEAQQVYHATDEGPLQCDATHLQTEVDQTWAALHLYLTSGNMPKADPEAAARFEAYHRARRAKSEKITLAKGLVRWNKLRSKKAADAVPSTSCPNDKIGKECCGLSPCRGGYTANTKLMQDMVQQDWGKETPLTAGTLNEDGTVKSPPAVSIASDVLVDPRSRPLLRIHGMVKENRKMVDQYVPILHLATRARVMSRYTTIVNTNRTSCGKPVNWQNPPKFGGFRECFGPDEGNVFASIDYKAIEVAALAQVLLERYGRSELARVINAGRDVHTWFAAILYGQTYEELAAQRKNPATKDRADKKRNGAKATVFGVPGGMGKTRIVETYGVDTFLAIAEPFEWAFVIGNKDRDLATDAERQVVAEAVAMRVKQVFLDAEPLMKDYFEWVARRTRDNQRFTWRDPRTGFLRGSVGYTDGCNTQFQGRAAAGAKRTMPLLTKACYGISTNPDDEVLHGVRPWGFVHDEFLFEGPRETAHLWADRASALMVQGMQTVIPDVLVEAEPALMSRWYKAAQCVRDASGKLLVWEPSIDTKPEERDPLDVLLDTFNPKPA